MSTVISLTSSEWISTDDLNGYMSNPGTITIYFSESVLEPLSLIGHPLPYAKGVGLKITPPAKLWLRPSSGNSGTVVITTE